MTRTPKLAGFEGDVSQDGQLVNKLDRNADAATSSVTTGTFQVRPSLKQTGAWIPGAGILLRPCEIAVQSTPEDDAINKGSCVSDPPSPRPGRRKKEPSRTRMRDARARRCCG
jgi:hypothetical protein